MKSAYIFPDADIENWWRKVKDLNRLEYIVARSDKTYWMVERNPKFYQDQIDAGNMDAFIATLEDIENRTKLLQVELKLDSRYRK